MSKSHQLGNEAESSESGKTIDGTSLFSRIRGLVFGNKGSLGARIGLLYSVFAIANLLFFVVMIFENQSDILLQLFQYRSRALVQTITKDLENLSETESTEDAFRAIGRRLELYDVKELILLDNAGTILAAQPEIASENRDRLSQRFKDEIVESSRSDALFDAQNLVRLNEEDFSVGFLIPVDLAQKRHYVSAVLNVSSMKERLTQIYIQAALVLAWVLVFHVGFAIYIFRVLIRRIQSLEKASKALSDGDLTARALWKATAGDELDELGGTFNMMADHIQANMQTIQGLNNRIQRELVIGKMVQSLIVHNRVDMSSYRPFVYDKPLREVSGDVFKFYEIAPGKKGFFFGDACGHGVSAALITALAIMVMDRYTPTIIHPAKLLRRLADELNESFEGSFYTTACFLLFDESRTRVYAANAGHIPPILLRPSTTQMLVLEASGPPAGTISDFAYKLQAVNVKSGDKVLICSDGIIEAMNDEKEIYGFERLQDVAKAHAEQSPEQLGQIIIEDLCSFTSEFHDDVSLVIMEVP